MKQLPLHGKHGVGKFALVDDGDYAWLTKFKFWLLPKSGYAITTIDGRNILLHCMLNPRKPELETDHINRNKLDNRRCNLRYVTKSENTRNVLRRDCQHGVRGVGFRPKARLPWTVHCSFNGKYRYIASYKTRDAAASAYVDYLDAVNKAPDDASRIVEKMRQQAYGSDRSYQSRSKAFKG